MFACRETSEFQFVYFHSLSVGWGYFSESQFNQLDKSAKKGAKEGANNLLPVLCDFFYFFFQGGLRSEFGWRNEFTP